MNLKGVWYAYVIRCYSDRLLRLEVLQATQEDIERQQEHVNSLQSMVVVVDDSNSDEGKKFAAACDDFMHINMDIEQIDVSLLKMSVIAN